MYFIVFCASVVDLIIFDMNKHLFGFTCFYVIMLALNIIVLRFVIGNASACNVLVAIWFASFLEVMVVATTIVFSIKGYYDPIYFNVYPLFWCIIELTTIYILYGFYRKLVDGDESGTDNVVGNHSGTYVPSLDIPIEYANTADGVSDINVSEGVGIELTVIVVNDADESNV